MNSHKVMSWVCMPCVSFWTATKRTVKVISNFQSLSCIMMITKEKLCWKEITKESVGWNQLFSDCYMHVCAQIRYIYFVGTRQIRRRQNDWAWFTSERCKNFCSALHAYIKKLITSFPWCLEYWWVIAKFLLVSIAS